MAIEAIPARRIRPLGLIAFASIVFMAIGTLHVERNGQHSEERYAARPIVKSYTQEQWREGAWKHVAARRIDLAGRSGEVFAAQWIGSLEQLESKLANEGWASQPTWRWQDAFSYLDTKAPLSKLPPRPVLHQGLKAKLTMARDEGGQTNRRLVLRAFKAHVDVTSEGKSAHVYLISITEEVPKSRFKLYAIPATLNADSKSCNAALADLAATPGVMVLAETKDPQKPLKVLLAKP